MANGYVLLDALIPILELMIAQLGSTYQRAGGRRILRRSMVS